ncbi:MAG TPA: ATP-binding protein [Syntrophobacteraceae bacterium]|nr:ATP-binding protein [Syntrophobacteraceae bacterium]HBD09966.1 ATP-binding protein [Syntrophobacteraceae bacterium]HBZ57302.1 ATP-binding protein [Syntrophobacteraceae bacterium]
MKNPFYLQEVPVVSPFCDRTSELRELHSFAEAKAHVVLYSPRRFGKTSLVKRVQKTLADAGAITIFSDLFGVASVEDVAARIAKAVFAVTHKRESVWKRALQVIQVYRPILKPDPEGGISLSVEPSSPGATGLQLLEETIASLGEFVRTTEGLVHVALDEFQEIVTLKEALQIEAVLRTEIQRQVASYFFVGSRRRVLLGIFNERQRPFFQGALNYPLKALPQNELEEFLGIQFQTGGKPCSEHLAHDIARRASYHPYYTQKLAFLVFEGSDVVTMETVAAGHQRLIASERPVFEAILQGLSPHQRLLVRAVALEPTGKPLANAYIRKHRLGSVGGVQHSLKYLSEMDLIERGDQWEVVDPLLAQWLRGQVEESL